MENLVDMYTPGSNTLLIKLSVDLTYFKILKLGEKNSTLHVGKSLYLTQLKNTINHSTLHKSK